MDRLGFLTRRHQFPAHKSQNTNAKNAQDNFFHFRQDTGPLPQFKIQGAINS
jgi:hypothetical protein